MPVKLAYLAVVLIWSTTPLGIKWSSVGLSFAAGAGGRMAIGAVLLCLTMLALRRPLMFHRDARRTYLAISLQLYLSMIVTYWSAQYIPSGWVSVIFGLNPFITAFMAAAMLGERSLSLGKLFAYLLGMTGLAVMFMSALDINRQALLGVAGVFLATIFHAFSAVWVKRINARLPAMQQLAGSLLFSLPLYILTWWVVDGGEIPAAVPEKTLFAIVYLGAFATTLGLTLYYYILTHLAATNVALLNLVTPVASLLLGAYVNREPLTIKTAIGTGLILIALLIYQLADRRGRLRAAK